MRQASSTLVAYVGCRTTRDRNARGDGINVFSINGTGEWSHLELVRGLDNPSFLAIDRAGRYLYAVHGDLHEISAFRIDRATGTLAFVNTQSTQGTNPVHVVVDPTNRYVIVANHNTSSLAVLPVEGDGSIGTVTDLVPLTGTIGPHRVEQPYPKPHQAQFHPSGAFFAVPDKGLDCTFSFVLDSGTGKLIHAGSKPAPAREGAGPRHIAFHPTRPYGYIANELQSTITTVRVGDARGFLEPTQVISSLPDTFVANSRASEIVISNDGRFVYASNRGHDSIGVFAVDQTSGHLRAVDWTSTQGRTPRFFTLDPSNTFLFAANEDSDTIVTFRVNHATGRLQPTGTVVQTGSPVCIVFGPLAPAGGRT